MAAGAGTCRAMVRGTGTEVRIEGGEPVGNEAVEFEKGSGTAEGDIVDGTSRGGTGLGGGEKVGLDDVRDVAEVAGLTAVAMDDALSATDQGGDPGGNNGRV